MQLHAGVFFSAVVSGLYLIPIVKKSNVLFVKKLKFPNIDSDKYKTFF